MSITFHVRINGGPEQTIKTKTGQYNIAAIAALSQLDYEKAEDFDVVKIWVPDLLPDYGPYFYGFDGHNIGIVPKSRQF